MTIAQLDPDLIHPDAATGRAIDTTAALDILIGKTNEVIESFVIAAQVYNVRDFGATGDGVTDDRVAIQATLDAASAGGGGTVYFPNGTYIISNSGLVGVGCLYPRSNTTVMGESRQGTIVKLKNSQAAFTRPFILDGVTNVVMRNFTIDGNKANQTVEEHRAGIFVWRNNGALPIPRFIQIIDMDIRNNSGDAIDLHQDPQDVIIERCFCHSNDRKALTINAGFQFRITVRDCVFSANAAGSIFTEANDPLFDLLVEGCYLEGNYADNGIAVSYAGPGAGENNVGAVFRNNVIKGCIQVLRAEDVQIIGNRIEVTDQLESPPVQLNFFCKNVLIEGNDVNLPTNAAAIDAIVQIQGAADSGSDFQPEGVRVIGNRLTTSYNNGHGVALVNVRDALVMGNRILSTASANVVAAVALASTISTIPIQVVQVIGNYLYNFGHAVRAGGTSAAMAVNDLVIVGNVPEKGPNASAVNAWDLDYLGFGVVKACAVTGNDIKGYAGFQTYPQVPVLVGGTRGAGGTWLVNNTPEGALTETVGAIAQRRNGGAGTSLYVKESGTGNTGWVGK